MRGATRRARKFPRTPRFQSTHPLRGATGQISTKAARSANFNPRTPCGVRLTAVPKTTVLDNFNPRTPCGVRPIEAGRDVSIISFQSTHPLRGATLYIASVFPQLTISIHAPLAGCDRCGSQQGHGRDHFNPRTPCGVRPVSTSSTVGAPIFQSTHPLRGATKVVVVVVGIDGISIHAPLAGCDT